MAGCDDIQAQAEHYRFIVARSGRAHYKAADFATAKNKYLGVPTAVLGALVGTAIFSAIQSTPAVGWKIATGLTSILASILATLQTLFNYSSAAASHREAGASYGALRRQFDGFMLRLPKTDRETLLADLDRLRSEIDRLGRSCPLIPKRAYSEAEKELDARRHLSRPPPRSA